MTALAEGAPRFSGFLPAFRFELGYRLRSRGTYVACLALTALTLRDLSSGYWAELMGGGVVRNSGYAAYYACMFSTFWAALLGSGLMTAPLVRDTSCRVVPLLGTRPIGDLGYFFGKYLASLLGLLLVMLGTALGFALLPVVGQLTGAAGEYGATPWGQLAHAVALFTVPAVFVHGTIHFALAALTGRAAPAYAAAVLYTLLWVALTVVYGDGGATPWLVQALDPIAKHALEAHVGYWTAPERLARYVELSGALLVNRALTLMVGAAVLIHAASRFDLVRLAARARIGAAGLEPSAPVVERARAPERALLASREARRSTNELSSAFALARFELALCWQDRVFRLFLFFCALSALLGAFQLGESGGPALDGALLPVTGHVLGLSASVFWVAALVTLVFQTGEIATRERRSRAHLLIDHTSAPTAVLFLGKCLAVLGLTLGLVACPVLATLSVQVGSGYWDFEPVTYLRRALLAILPSLLAYAAITLLFHAVSARRGVGHALGFLFAFSIMTLEHAQIVEHSLLLFGYSAMGVEYSSFDVFSEFFEKLLLGYYAYWLPIGGLCLLAAYLLWPRGIDARLWSRLRHARQRVGRRGVALAALCAALVGYGGVTSYAAMNEDNIYRARDTALERRAEYERRHGVKRALAQPVIRHAALWLDFEPHEQRARFGGTLALDNPHERAITELALQLPERVLVEAVRWNGRALPLVASDAELGSYDLLLDAPLEPGADASLSFALELRQRGFANRGFAGTLVRDGAIFGSELVPAFGYERARELVSPSERRRRGLPPRVGLERAATRAPLPLLHSDDANLVLVEWTVRVPPGVVAIAAGALTADRVEGGQRVFHYRSTEPELWRPAVVMGGYAVSREHWRSGPAEIEVEVHHHPAHQHNVRRILSAAALGLEHVSAWLGRYPHDVVRIVETPHGLSPERISGGMLTLPERRAWLHDYRVEPALDWIQFIVTRQLARAALDRLAPSAALPGALLIENALPEALAALAVEARHGEAQRALLERDYLERYRRGRAVHEGEVPALLDADGEAFLEPAATLLLLHARDALGDERFRAALKTWLERARAAPGSATAKDLAEALELTPIASDPKRLDDFIGRR